MLRWRGTECAVRFKTLDVLSSDSDMRSSLTVCLSLSVYSPCGQPHARLISKLALSGGRKGDRGGRGKGLMQT